ncbi:hypothetical protein L9F63_012208, partial [Diploptera punctata]
CVNDKKQRIRLSDGDGNIIIFKFVKNVKNPINIAFKKVKRIFKRLLHGQSE